MVGFLAVKGGNRDGGNAFFFGKTDGEILFRFLGNVFVGIDLELTSVAGQGFQPGFPHLRLDIISFLLHVSPETEVVFFSF